MKLSSEMKITAVKMVSATCPCSRKAMRLQGACPCGLLASDERDPNRWGANPHRGACHATCSHA